MSTSWYKKNKEKLKLIKSYKNRPYENMGWKINLDWLLTYIEISRRKELEKIKSAFLGMYIKNKSLDKNKGIICGQYDVINTSISLGVPISQDILFQKFYPNIKVDTKFFDIINSPCVDSTLMFGNVRFLLIKTVFLFPVWITDFCAESRYFYADVSVTPS